MKIEDNSILIIGGATGIGFVLAEAFVEKVAKSTLEALQKDENEIVVGMAQGLRDGSRNNPE